MYNIQCKACARIILEIKKKKIILNIKFLILTLSLNIGFNIVICSGVFLFSDEFGLI